VRDRSIYVEKLQLNLLIRDHYVDVVHALQAMIADGEQTVAISRQVDTYNFGGFYWPLRREIPGLVPCGLAATREGQ
jgi:hypothetical protein